MGSSSSKHNADEPSTSSSSSVAGRRARSRGGRGFQSSCLRPPTGFDDSDDDEQIADYQNEENCYCGPSCNCIVLHSNHTKAECCRKIKADKLDATAHKSCSTETDEWGESSFSDNVSRAGCSSQAFSTRLLSPPNRFLSRCSFFPGYSSFRLGRPTSVDLSRAYPASSRSFMASNEQEDLNLGKAPALGSVGRTKYPRGRELLPSCLTNIAPSPQNEGRAIGCSDSNTATSGFSHNLQDDQIVSPLTALRDGNNHSEQCNVNLQTPTNFINVESTELRHTDRRIGAREPVDRNVHFSRTLSVGRLRDRVLRRSSFPDLAFSPLQQERDVRDAGEGVGTGVLESNESALISSHALYPSSSTSSSLYNSHDYEVETSRLRDTRYHDLLEHRSNFLERRRRIRSQVRALQRLGSRFENLSGHERSCIISGEHRTGHCVCRNGSRDSFPNDDTGARQSISRIVMLAEALFEVLDEIHQQSAVLSSRPLVSSIGSIPAPNDVVENLPLKLYSKLQKHFIEDAAQCYICLVEYEEGDTVRTLPCHHEFHRTCVDKWLKEIHRVCPLCRGDICITESMPVEN